MDETNDKTTDSIEMMEPFVITEAAARGYDRFMKERDASKDAVLRVGVRGGGCSGFSYAVEVDPKGPRPDDHVLVVHERRFVVDPKSMRLLAGCTLDYRSGLMNAGFTFKNPRATKTCGCGESFSIG